MAIMVINTINYRSPTYKFLDFIEKKGLYNLSMFFAVLLLDFNNALKIGFNSARGLKRNFHTRFLNPKTLSFQQARQEPILLIHGAAHTQGVWIPFSKRFHKDGGQNPLFTVNLPNGDVTMEDVKRIEDKVMEIRRLYSDAGAKPPKIHFVAYSRGGAALKKFAKTFPRGKSQQVVNSQIGKLIFLGYTISNYRKAQFLRTQPKLSDRIVNFSACKDYLDLNEAPAKGIKGQILHTTHLGLVHIRDLHRTIKRSL